MIVLTDVQSPKHEGYTSMFFSNSTYSRTQTFRYSRTMLTSKDLSQYRMDAICNYLQKEV